MYTAGRNFSPLPMMETKPLKPTVLGSTVLKGGLFASLVLLGTACSSESAVTKPASDGAPNGIVAGALETSSANGTVTLRNTTELSISYLLVDKDQAVAAIYPVCGVAHCANLTQGSSATVSYLQIPGTRQNPRTPSCTGSATACVQTARGCFPVARKLQSSHSSRVL